MTAAVLQKYLGRPKIVVTRPTLNYHYEKNMFSKQRIRWGHKLTRLQASWTEQLLPGGKIVTFSKLHKSLTYAHK
jgi:hypothetical protein